MTEYTKLIERLGERYGVPDLSTDQLLNRRDRKRRNQRIAAGVVGIAVFVAAVWIVTSVGSLDRTQRPANEPSTVNSAEDVARGFIAAFGAFDPEAAMTYVADDADLQGLIYPETSFVIPSPLVDPAAGRENLRMMLALMEAAGYQQTITSCQAAPFGSGTSVVCGFDFNAIASDELGLGPVTGNRFLFTVVDGEIVRAWVDWDTRTISSQLLKPFRDWVSATHPKDVRVMFGPPSKGVNGYLDPRYTNESIRLWRLRTPEYAESVQATAPLETGPAVTGPAVTGPAVAPDWYDDWYDAGFLVGSSRKEPEYAIPPEGAVPSTPEEGELVAQFRGPYPGRFAYVYADGRVISWRHSPIVIGERRLTPEGVELVRSGALQPEAFIGHAYEVPLDVWENPKVKPFVPSRYAVCYSMESGAVNYGKMGGYEYPSRVVGFFPAPARAILRGETSFVAEGDDDSAPLECSEVTTDEARALVDILGDRSVEDLEGDRIITEITMMLPHGIRIYCTHCG